jgi:hypothetical protein
LPERGFLPPSSRMKRLRRGRQERIGLIEACFKY